MGRGDDRGISTQAGSVARSELRAGDGFAVDEAEVTFWGLCTTCQTEQKTNRGDDA